ncbi:uncharacterized protein [Montipora capricornis]|uniref:uncharacterized protein n=1 Tax=Montipora capricornis TaxID=246305 RepID=UPI0035F16F6D
MIRQKLKFSRIPRPVKSIAESISSLRPCTSGLSGISSFVPAIPPVPVVSLSFPATSSPVIKSVAESTYGVCCVSSSPAVSCAMPSQSTRAVPSQSTCTMPSQSTCAVSSQSSRAVPCQSTRVMPSQSTHVPFQSSRPLSFAVKSAPVSVSSSPVPVTSSPVFATSSPVLSSPLLVSSFPVLDSFPFRPFLCLLFLPVFDRCSSRFVICPILCPVPVVCLFRPF